ncbi:hypothetical protein RRG08_030618 [Elysia crispata]|uniref:Uncharacterized protein n=1 Tax=Elysia crispata TaxID=231223 RepID=A0AAE1D679_9GAST|nr:hypothetical protein RRG08_030618 [Elysia crispata]
MLMRPARRAGTVISADDNTLAFNSTPGSGQETMSAETQKEQETSSMSQEKTRITRSEIKDLRGYISDCCWTVALNHSRLPALLS